MCTAEHMTAVAVKNKKHTKNILIIKSKSEYIWDTTALKHLETPKQSWSINDVSILQ